MWRNNAAAPEARPLITKCRLDSMVINLHPNARDIHPNIGVTLTPSAYVARVSFKPRKL